MRAASLTPLIAALALSLSACGGDDDPAPASTGAAAPAATSAADPTAQSGTQTLTGTGYRTLVPEGWTDQSKLAEGTAIKIDRLYASTKGATQGQNLVVIRENPAGLKGKKIGDLEEQIRTQAANAVGAPVPDSEPASKLDGEDARGWTLKNSQGGSAKIQRQLVALHDDVLYTLTVTTSTTRDDSEALLKGIVAGWRWQ